MPKDAEQLYKLLDITPVDKYAGFNKMMKFTCNKCDVKHTCSLLNYERRAIRCCEDGKHNRKMSKRITVNGREFQVDFEKVLVRVEEICATRGGQCLDIDVYINDRTLLSWQCNVCDHEWSTNLNNIYHKKSWCPNCSVKESEKKCRLILEYITGEKFLSARPEWLSIGGRSLELDCYNESLMIALEYGGIQHYKKVDHFHRPANYKDTTQVEYDILVEEKFQHQLTKDKAKVSICKTRGVNLIVISYLDMQKGIPHVKQVISTRLDYTVDSEWLLTDDVGFTYDRASLDRKMAINTELATRKFVLVNPNIVVNGFRQRFQIRCHNDHVFTTYMDNLINHKRGCLECLGKHRWDIDSVKDWMTTNDSDIQILSTKYVNVGTNIDYICTCGVRALQSFDNIKRGLKLRKRVCKSLAHDRHPMIKLDRLLLSNSSIIADMLAIIEKNK